MSVQGIMEADAAVKNAKARLLEAENDKRVQNVKARATEAERLLGASVVAIDACLAWVEGAFDISDEDHEVIEAGREAAANVRKFLDAWETGEEDCEYSCINGHDKCPEMSAGPDCPYCEKVQP